MVCCGSEEGPHPWGKEPVFGGQRETFLDWRTSRTYIRGTQPISNTMRGVSYKVSYTVPRNFVHILL